MWAGTAGVVASMTLLACGAQVPARGAGLGQCGGVLQTGTVSLCQVCESECWRKERGGWRYCRGNEPVYVIHTLCVVCVFYVYEYGHVFCRRRVGRRMNTRRCCCGWSGSWRRGRGMYGAASLVTGPWAVWVVWWSRPVGEGRACGAVLRWGFMPCLSVPGCRHRRSHW